MESFDSGDRSVHGTHDPPYRDIIMGNRRARARDAQIAAAVKASHSIAEALRALGLQSVGGNYRTIHSAVTRLGLDTRHWTGQGHRKGIASPIVPAKPLVDVLVRGRPYRSSLLRHRLLEEGLMEPRCSRCLLEMWQDVPIPLELDHIDGDPTNNELSNLRLLCPNCHALTPTYRGRNKALGRRKSDNMPASPGGEMVYAGDLTN